MRISAFKTFAAAGALALGLLASPIIANAALGSEHFDITLETDSGIDSANVADIDFGTWFVVVRNSETPTLTMDAATGLVTVAGDTLSDLSVLTAGAGAGEVTVTVPAATIMTMTRTGAATFSDTGIALTKVTYHTATEDGNIDTSGSDAPVTVTAGSTPEPVKFGGELTFSATPADAAHVTTFDVSFAY